MGIRFFDMFAGIGGFRSGLEAVGGYECVGSCEIDPYARKAYETLYDTKGELFFANARTTTPEELPDLDLICGGFPCQSFSLAGKRLGFCDDARGTLFFEIARLAEAKRPALLLLENVPGLLSHDRGRTFTVILRTLDELGYDVAWKVYNSKDFGVPQVRRRVYLAGFLRGKCAGWVLPDPPADDALPAPAEGIAPDAGIPIKAKTAAGYQMAYPGDSIDLSYSTTNSRRGRVGKQIAHTLTTAATQGCYTAYPVALNRQDGIKGIVDTAVTINASDWRGLNRNQTQTAVLDEHARVRLEFRDREGRLHRGGLRKLTPREYWRLQGFTDAQFDAVSAQGFSDTRLYKMAGNAVTVPVISFLAGFLRDVWETEACL